MADKGASVERRFAAPRTLVWALLADSNRYDRALGLSIPQYAWREVEGRRVLYGRAKQGGISMEWIEEPYEWIEGRRLTSRRTFTVGPAKVGGLKVDVEDDGDGCRARLTAYGEANSFVLKLLDPLVRRHLERQISKYLDAVAQVVETDQASALVDPEQPAAMKVQALLAVLDNTVTSGGRTASNVEELRRRAGRLDNTPVDREVATALVRTLEQRPDEEISQMRPFELAQHWGLDRRRVLQGFLHATRAGLVDLAWQINCPVCRVSAQVVDTLGDVGRDVHCEACNISYGVDFGANVEAVFRCNRAIRDVTPAVYCAASPAFRPHVFAQLRLEAGEQRELTLELCDGHLNLRTLERQTAAHLDDPRPPASIEVEIDGDAVTVRAEGIASDEPTRVRVRSTLDHPTYLLVERAAWSADAVLGSVVASQPDFVDLFATEAPAAGLDLTIGNLALLFSDLTGSTALYERVGDARAYAIVQEHFRIMEAVIATHEGAVVKTMGDAVMASFATASNAVAAAIAAAAETEARHGEHGIGVKLGVHEGPCLAVRANERLDFFGTTVNLTARLQGQAKAGELVLMQALAEHPAVATTLGDRPRRAMRVHLKGIAEEQPLVAVDVRPRSDDESSR